MQSRLRAETARSETVWLCMVVVGMKVYMYMCLLRRDPIFLSVVYETEASEPPKG
ncbi:hypothetical protein GQ43DRAFT_438246 [Delitschia confertaspora ATCC 74209]|uniref:Uncharacterized protein n=1 Tax=Delitschia confertaspora ATCC 74209 TaxID=1513339 RepID=A0A9P4JQZ6_9PLEO|nr:hypothetical protein GQ43DRAFT_438246 [Delitschia confertaspora ATCC 74209]